MNKKLPYDLTKEEIAELLKRKKEISDFVFEQFKSDPMNKEINWKQAHDMQQKLVISYVLENEKLKDRIKELEEIEGICTENDCLKMHSHILETANDELDRANKIMKDTLINIWECFEIRSEIYHNDWVGFQALANKARICLEEIGYGWEKAPCVALSPDKAPGS